MNYSPLKSTNKFLRPAFTTKKSGPFRNTVHFKLDRTNL